MMKKLLFLSALIFMGFNQIQAQGDLKLGINGGLPVGDAEDFSNFQLGADIAYLFGVMNVIEVGPMLGYSVFFVEDIETGFGEMDTDDVSFLPIAASGRLGLGMAFLGLDLGYAVSLNEDGEGGFYYRPKIGVGLGIFSIIGSYQGISNNGENLSSVNVGLEFQL
ncbi:MAG: hypothetical protein ACQEWD_13380 [Bacteroidota bacterium]|uniref:Outer membrane protein beta-barrel domain-containing protein n=1 Tax=Salegentibacter flavus TaxID=287099 RepID=A0A1I5BR41_9FLAO|nr:hypothetical protein [Salegentibacter flavus]SFN77116.1 hypothetical protein SAMN05660413_02508 [Salegentibacter flavus]